jgi:protein-L-isoaspartate(D-aspartate) O-methyltransferase
MIKGQLATNGIRDPRIIEALAHVDRAQFVPDTYKNVAYIDEALKLCANRYLLEPLLFAKMLDYAELSQHHSVLDIGAGLGYSSAVIARLVSHVCAVEENAELVASARKRLKEGAFHNVEMVTAPLENGCATHAPYDKIFVHGVLHKIPTGYEQQLAEGGTIIALLSTHPMFATRKILCSVVVGKKNSGHVTYSEKEQSFAYTLKKTNEETRFNF